MSYLLCGSSPALPVDILKCSAFCDIFISVFPVVYWANVFTTLCVRSVVVMLVVDVILFYCIFGGGISTPKVLINVMLFGNRLQFFLLFMLGCHSFYNFLKLNFITETFVGFILFYVFNAFTFEQQYFSYHLC